MHSYLNYAIWCPGSTEQTQYYFMYTTLNSNAKPEILFLKFR